jgi:hypothetical protein
MWNNLKPREMEATGLNRRNHPASVEKFYIVMPGLALPKHRAPEIQKLICGLQGLACGLLPAAGKVR